MSKATLVRSHIVPFQQLDISDAVDIFPISQISHFCSPLRMFTENIYYCTEHIHTLFQCLLDTFLSNINLNMAELFPVFLLKTQLLEKLNGLLPQITHLHLQYFFTIDRNSSVFGHHFKYLLQVSSGFAFQSHPFKYFKIGFFRMCLSKSSL